MVNYFRLSTAKRKRQQNLHSYGTKLLAVSERKIWLATGNLCCWLAWLANVSLFFFFWFLLEYFFDWGEMWKNLYLPELFMKACLGLVPYSLCRLHMSRMLSSFSISEKWICCLFHIGPIKIWNLSNGLHSYLQARYVIDLVIVLNYRMHIFTCPDIIFWSDPNRSRYGQR